MLVNKFVSIFDPTYMTKHAKNTKRKFRAAHCLHSMHGIKIPTRLWVAREEKTICTELLTVLPVARKEKTIVSPNYCYLSRQVKLMNLFIAGATSNYTKACLLVV